MIDPFAPLIGRRNIQTIVYLRNPKCASSTLYKAFGERNLFWRERKLLEQKLCGDKKYAGLFDVSHCLPSEAFSCFGRGILNLFTVSCCRNPYEKQVSQYSFSNGKNFGTHYGVSNSGTFKEYCELLYKRRNDPTFWPAIPQTVFTHGCLPLTFLIRFENLQDDWETMIKNFQIQGLQKTLAWENKSEHNDWREYYCSETKAIVDELFEIDFNLLKYKQIIS